jgi:SAM-dependent methyltransferase
MRPYLDYNPPLAIWINRSLFRHLNECTSQMQILNLGSGDGLFDKYLQPHLNFVNLDVSLAKKDVDVAADAHALPFGDESLDAVYSNAVLEHVQRPWVVVDEIYRVLRPGGKVFINLPFLNVIHDTHDYFRFTDKGLQILFSSFEEIDSGVSAGPSSFLGPFFVAAGLHSQSASKSIVAATALATAWPIKYLDLLIRNSADLRLTADAFYFVGSKKS